MSGEIKFVLMFKEYHPPLWLYFWAGEQYLKYYQEISGTDVGILYKTANNELTGYMQTNAKEVIYESLKDKINKPFFDSLYEVYKNRLHQLGMIKKEIDAMATRGEGISDEQIVTYSNMIHEITGNLYPMSNALYVLSEKIEEIAKAKLGGASVVSYLYPSYKTKAIAFKSDLIDIRKKHFGDEEISKDVVAERYQSDKTFQVTVEDLVEKYQYVTSLNMGLRDAKSFFPDIAGAVVLEKTEIPPKIIQEEIDALNHITFFKDEMSTFVVPYVKFALLSFWEQIAKRLGVSLEEFEQFHINEVASLLDMPHDDVLSLARNRRKFSLYFHLPFGELNVKEGDAAQTDFIKLEKDFVETHEPINTGIIKGRTGSGGKVAGRVQVIHGVEEMSKFNVGNILVTAYTAPDFVPIMKKAIAIVTDTGGVTSHAAIVSRELSVPCVVGTKVATKILKDGDMVEVDANNGIVKILEK